MRRSRRGAFAAACLFIAVPAAERVHAQEHVAVGSEILFYGDNTEFSNPFREGETIFGAAFRVAATIDLNERTSVMLGGMANERFGSDSAFEQARPIVALIVGGKRSKFIFGTFPAPSPEAPKGPDLNGPHELLPPIQRETLAYDRPFEAGLGWTFSGTKLDHRFWINWQRLNTASHRERFDGGVNTSWRLSPRFLIPAQLHVVHEGGQLYSSGPVADSIAAALGVHAAVAAIGSNTIAVELYGLVSRFVPDRSESGLSRDGTAFFGRTSIERTDWRGHVIFWRGRNFLKDEGDPNYVSVRRSGMRYRGTRDYAEAGLTRRFALARTAMLDVSGRLHRIEGRYEYSYRITSTVSTLWHVK